MSPDDPRYGRPDGLRRRPIVIRRMIRATAVRRTAAGDLFGSPGDPGAGIPIDPNN